MQDVHRFFAQKGITRARERRILGGVCAGIAQRFGLDPWLVRLGLFALVVVLPGSPLLLYPLAWIVIPEGEQVVHRQLVAVAPESTGSVTGGSGLPAQDAVR